MQPEELKVDEFLAKLTKPEGFVVLIEDWKEGRFIMHVYRPRDMVMYISPKVYEMGDEPRHWFVNNVEIAAMHPRGTIKRFQW